MINNATGKLGENAFDFMTNNIKDKANTFSTNESGSNFADFLPKESTKEIVNEKAIVENAEVETSAKSNNSDKINEDGQDNNKDENANLENTNIIPAFWIAMQNPINGQIDGQVATLNQNLEAIDINAPKIENINLALTINANTKPVIDLNVQLNTNQDGASIQENIPSNDGVIAQEFANLENTNANIEGQQLSASALNELAKIGIGDKSLVQKDILAKTENKTVSVATRKTQSFEQKINSNETEESELPNELGQSQILDTTNLTNPTGELSLKTNPIEKDKSAKINLEKNADNIIEFDFNAKTEKLENNIIQSEGPKLNINNLDALAAMMVKKAANGEKTFFVRLDPAELGKVEVELKFGQDSKISAIIKADNPQALNELMRSAKDLVLSLNQAGLEMKEQDLSFSLNNNGFDNSQNSFANQKQSQEQKNLFQRNIELAEKIIPEIENVKPIKHEIWGQTRISIRA